jgi:hypothetical protein
MVLRSFIRRDNKKPENGGGIEWVGHSQLGNNGLRVNDFNTTVFANLYKLRLHFVQDGESRTLQSA